MITDLMEEAVDALFYFGRFRMEEATEKLADTLTKAAAGDSDAFTSLMLQLEPKLRATIKARTHGSLQPSEIDDVMQSVWVEVFEKGLLQKVAGPRNLMALLSTVAKNKAINASKEKAKAGVTHRSTTALGPLSPGVVKAGRGASQLSMAQKKIVRKAVTKALAKAKLKPEERLYVSMLFGMDPGGDLHVADYGGDLERAKKAGMTGSDNSISSRATRIKLKFLRHFCTDRELCDLLPPGRARTQITKIAGLGQNACKGVKDTCMDDEDADDVVTEFAYRIGALSEADPQNVEGDAGELVLSWLTETLAGT